MHAGVNTLSAARSEMQAPSLPSIVANAKSMICWGLASTFRRRSRASPTAPLFSVRRRSVVGTGVNPVTLICSCRDIHFGANGNRHPSSKLALQTLNSAECVTPQLSPGRDDGKFTQCTYTGRDKVFPASQALLMLVRIGCEFEFETLDMTPSLWQVRPRPDGDHRIVSQTWEPPGPTHTYIDAYGNECDRVDLPPGRSVMRYDATVDVPSNPDKANEGAGRGGLGGPT